MHKLKGRAGCQFWFYTRAFGVKDRYPLLERLASLPNCKGWLSIDADNWMAGVSAYHSAPVGVWKLALLQTPDLPESLLVALRKIANRQDVVNFPLHSGPHHIMPLKNEPVMNCPEILGAFTRSRKPESLRPCPQCQICLPALSV